MENLWTAIVVKMEIQHFSCWVLFRFLHILKTLRTSDANIVGLLHKDDL